MPQPPWLELKLDVSAQVLTMTANIYGVSVEVIAGMLDEYIMKFRGGPEVFWPWYTAQRAAWHSGQLPFEPWFPHEVFPSLAQDDASWFYGWRRENEYENRS